MIEFLDSATDVIALRVGGKIEGSDLDSILDRLEPMLESPGKIHVFVETQAISGVALDGLPRYTARAMPLFGKLHKFGRVAVVADQAWVRWGTRLESAMLPNISYRVFEPEARDEALAWVKGAGQPD